MAVPQQIGVVTQLLRKWSSGDSSVTEVLTPLVYAELRKLAASYMRSERRNHTLQPTALIHEAWIRLIDQGQPNWDSRAQFFRFASHLMRQVLVDHARRRLSAKRGSGVENLAITAVESAQPQKAIELLALDEALTRLAAFDEQRARILELRYFGGLSEQETAESLDRSIATVRRHLRIAEAWLFKELSGPADKRPGGAHET
jgi:RNA polymerase sigma factor (TIGR02999 family)